MISPNQAGIEGTDGAEVWMFTGEEAIVGISPPSYGNVISFPLKKAHFLTLPLPLPTSLRHSWAMPSGQVQ